MIARTLLHYKILQKLGEGGMGVVYLAEDTKLDRRVAIKLLPHHITGDEKKRRRFESEAKSAASLNHPNITTIHNIEETDDAMFIVMEYIQGRNLKEMVGTTVMSSQPLEYIMNIALQIANGMKAAHKKGIIHRDIKSENIMITEEGDVRIMDFGLAKFQDSAQLTQSGDIIGTAAYMSPEQVAGKVVDERSDIWSFGVVLYELLTGCLPFSGDNTEVIIYSILSKEPKPIFELHPGLPSQLNDILYICLQKNKDDRYKSASELFNELWKITGICSHCISWWLVK